MLSRLVITKEVKNLYTKKQKALMKKIEEDTNKWKDMMCSRIERINSSYMAILAKVTYRFNAIPNKISMAFFREIEWSILKFIRNYKKQEDKADVCHNASWFQTELQSYSN